MEREYWDVWKVEMLTPEEIVAKCGTRVENINKCYVSRRPQEAEANDGGQEEG